MPSACKQGSAIVTEQAIAFQFQQVAKSQAAWPLGLPQSESKIH